MTATGCDGSVVVAGIGNSYRRDDGAGVAVAAGVAAADPAVADVGPAVDPLDLLGRWDDAELAVVIDAVQAELPEGTVVVEDLADFTGPADGAPAVGVTSSHGIGVTDALRLARAVGRAPGRVVLVGVVGTDFGPGAELSPAVGAAVAEAVGRVLELVEEARRCA